jgi:hypothetical protein
MFNLFSVSIKDLGEMVQIMGVSYYDLAKDIEKFYNTSLITKHQVKRETWDTVKLQKFYLLELRNILIALLKIKNLRSNRRKLNELKEQIELNTWVKDTINMSGKPFDMKRLKAFKTTPFPKQLEFLEQYPVITYSYHLDGLLLDAKAGSGKAMPLSTRVKTPGGWTRLGDLKEGGKVITPNGRIATIVGIYPQGVTAVYRFTFADGRTADSHPDHQWEVVETHDDHAVGPQVTTTQDIINHFDDFKYSIPLVTKIDGATHRSVYSNIVQLAQDLFTSGQSIDESVLELSYQNRFDLIKEMIWQGSLKVDDEGLYFYTGCAVAAENFRRLMWSTGGIAHPPVKTGNRYEVSFKHRDSDVLAQYFVDMDGPDNKALRLDIVSYEQRESEETLCISIDSEDSLYVVDDYVVTHNTFTSIAWSHLLNDAPTVVLCPMNIVNKVWVTELPLHYKEAPKVWTSLLGTLPTEGYDYYIVHYDYMMSGAGAQLQKFLIELNKKHKGECKLIIDECHNFNEMKAARTRRLIDWADTKCFGHYLPMSGTPLKAMGSEIYPVLCLIDRFFKGKVRDTFLASYGKNRPAMTDLLAMRIGRSKFTIGDLVGIPDAPPVELVNVKIPNGDQYTLDAIRLQMQIYISERIDFYTRHMPEFLAFYNEVILSYEQANRKDPRAMGDLLRYKEIVHRFRTVGYSTFTDSADSMFCKQVEERIEADLKGNALKEFRNVKSAVKYLGLKLRGEALGNVLGRARINAIKDLIAHAGIPEMINSVEKKTLIFTSYVESMAMCNEYLIKEGFDPITVYGENSKERDANIDRFRDNPRVNPLVAVIQSLKEGYPLVMANLTILLDSPFREHEMKQIVARTVRVGQDSPCFFKLLNLDTGDKLNITTRSINIMEWSREQVDALLTKENDHNIFGDVAGTEMYQISQDEEYTFPLKPRSPIGVFSIFS